MTTNDSPSLAWIRGRSEAHLRYNLPDDEFKGPNVGYSYTLQPENLEFWTPTGDTTVMAKIVDNDPYRVSVRAFSSSIDEGQPNLLPDHPRRLHRRASTGKGNAFGDWQCGGET